MFILTKEVPHEVTSIPPKVTRSLVRWSVGFNGSCLRPHRPNSVRCFTGWLPVLCPGCGMKSDVVDSRVRGTLVRRRRRCGHCGLRWATREVPEEHQKIGRPTSAPEAHPVVRFVFEEKARQGISYEQLAGAARTSVRTLVKWRSERIPRVDTLTMVLDALGYDLYVRKKKGDPP